MDERGDSGDLEGAARDRGPYPLSIRLFGELELQFGDVRLAPLESRRARSLLAFLLLHREAPQSRERLAFLLWPDSTETQARTNLRHLIHTLRQADPELGRFVEVTPNSLRWREDLTSWLDVAAFEDAAAAARAEGLSAERQLEALRHAIDLYRGDLLDGCYDEWLLDERERLRDSYLTQLQRLGAILAEDDQHSEAISVARELLRCDPLRESTYRLLMGVHAAAGDRADAVRIYHECVSTLHRELGVEPSAETQAAYADLMRSLPAVMDPPDPQLLRVGSVSLVGRSRAWQQLGECWARFDKGHAQFVLVSGEAGIGKTRLVDEFAAWATHRGGLVASARSYPTEGELGYGVVTSWLRSPDVAVNLRRGAPSQLAVLSRLLPELADARDATAAADFGSAEERRRLFESIAAVLAVSGRPTLLIADDAQWCDAQTLQLIHYLVRRDSDNPVLVVATARPEDFDESHALGVLSSGLHAIDRSTEITLDRLSAAETDELVRSLVGSAVDAAMVDDLYAETEGNPLFIVETMRAGWDGASRSLSMITPKLHAVITSRFRKLSSSARDVLDMAATVGREFTAAVLAGALDFDELRLVRGLDELWRRGILREHGIDAYDFAHGKIRDVAYEALSSATRRRNHRMIAEVLVRLDRRDLGAASGEIARHFDRGGQASEAITWYRRAAAHAQSMHADREAIRLLDRARDLNAELADGDEQLERELSIRCALVTPLAAVEGFASTRLAEAQQRSVELADALGVEPEPSLLRSMAMTRMCHHDFDGAHRVAELLRSCAGTAGDHVLQVESDYLLGIGAFWNGSFEQARTHFECVVREFEPERRLEHIVRFGHDPRIVCLSRLANTLWFLGAADEARRLRSEALAMAVDVGHPFSRGVAFVFAAILCLELDDLDGFREFVHAVDSDADNLPFAAARDSLIGYLDVIDGHPEAGIGRIEQTIRTGVIDHAPGQRATHLRLLLAACDRADDPVRGLAAADAALLGPSTLIWEAEARRLRARFLAGVGAPADEIDRELGRAMEAAGRAAAVGPQRTIEATRCQIVPSR